MGICLEEGIFPAQVLCLMEDRAAAQQTCVFLGVV